MKDIISVSFVGVFKQSQTMMPVLDNRFCKDLFHQPYETFNGVSPEGFTVALNGKAFPLLVINPQKVIFKAKTKEDLLEYVHAVKEEFARINFSSEYVAYGINWEIQWLDLPNPADIWLWNRFIDDKIKTNSVFQTCGNISMRFGVNDTEVLNLTLEPRKGRHNGVFGSVNHHHSVSFESLPEGDELTKMIKDSYELLFDKYLPNIIEE